MLRIGNLRAKFAVLSDFSGKLINSFISLRNELQLIPSPERRRDSFNSLRRLRNSGGKRPTRRASSVKTARIRTCASSGILPLGLGRPNGFIVDVEQPAYIRNMTFGSLGNLGSFVVAAGKSQIPLARTVSHGHYKISVRF